MNSLVCVDAGVIIWALLPFPLSDQAEALMEYWRHKEMTLIAPALFAFEVTSALRRLVYLREITPDQGERAFKQYLQLNVRLSQQRGIFPLAWRLAQQYITISRDRQAAKGGNYLDMAGTTLGWVIYRIYVPDQGKDRQGGVPLPSVTLIAQDGTPHPLQLCAFPDFATAAQSVLAYLRANGFDDAADLLERKLAEGDDGGVGTGTTCAPDQVAFAIPQNTGGYFPNAANKYIAAPDLCFQPGRIVVVRGKAPVVPNTYYGDPVWRPPGQSAKLDMRYYSMCNNVQEKPFPVVLCKADWDTKLDSQGYYTYVMSEDESGTTPPTPPGWVSPAATWLPWGSIVFRNILLMRHMLPAASFGQSVQAAIEAGCTFDNESGVPVSCDDIAAAGQCAQEVMGPYYPVAVRCDKALYIAQGWQGCFAAAGVPAP